MDLYLIGILIVILLLGAVHDAIRQKIPNLLTFPVIFFAIIYQGLIGGLAGITFSIGGLTIGFGFFLFLYAIGGMGAGDVKLMGAVGAILGPKGAIAAIFCTALAGLLYSILLITIYREFGRDFLARAVLFFKAILFTRKFITFPAADNIYRPKLCYGIAIAAGTMFSVGMEYMGYTLI